MSWKDWAAQVTANGANSECMILAKDGSQAWGAVNCGVYVYKHKIDNGQGGHKEVSVDEGKRIATIMKLKGVPSKSFGAEGGLFINKKKYMTLRYLDDIKALYLKGPGTTGGCL